MASASTTWTEDEVAAISLFWPGRNAIKSRIEGKLIRAMMGAQGALQNYPGLVGHLHMLEPWEKDRLKNLLKKDELLYTLYSEMLTPVFGKTGKETNIGIFFEAMKQIGWTAGIEAIVAVNWTEIVGLDKPVVKIENIPEISKGDDVVDIESSLGEGLFEFDPEQAERELSDETRVDGYFKGEVLKVEVVKAKKVESGPGIYKMSANPRGVALIINNTFEEPENGGKKINSARHGSQHDENYMGMLFSQLGFLTLIKRNVTKKALADLMKKYRSHINKTMDCFPFVIMSHGVLNKIQMADGKDMNIYTDFLPEITTKMGLDYGKKPKLVFFQACQSLEADDGPCLSKGTEKTVTNLTGHVRLFYPSLPANVAWRQEATGSRFIYAVAKVFMEQAHEKDIDELHNEVAKVMESMHLPKGCQRQTPQISKQGVCDTLYFNPGLYDEN